MRGAGRSRDGRGPGPGPSAIHRGLTGARPLVGTPYLADDELRGGYAREIAPRTEGALARILGEVFGAAASEGSSSAPGPATSLRALDLGAGTGAVGTALRAHFGARVSVLEVDRHVSGPGRRVIDVTAGAALETLGTGFDLVVAAHLLNELHLDEVAAEARDVKLGALAHRWLERLLAPSGTLILLEPALRETSRALLRVRDRLLAAGEWHAVAPCFCQTACPALLRERDWCHDSAPGPDHRRIDFSYLVVRRGAGAAADPEHVRIVSDPLPEKGKLRLYACGVGGRSALVRLDRHASGANADLDRLARGDVARLAPALVPAEGGGRGDGLRIGPDTRVERVEVRARAASGASGEEVADGRGDAIDLFPA